MQGAHAYLEPNQSYTACMVIFVWGILFLVFPYEQIHNENYEKPHLAEVSIHIHHHVGAYQNMEQTEVIPLRSHILLSIQAGTDIQCPVTPCLSTAHQIPFVCQLEEGKSRAGKL